MESGNLENLATYGSFLMGLVLFILADWQDIMRKSGGRMKKVALAFVLIGIVAAGVSQYQGPTKDKPRSSAIEEMSWVLTPEAWKNATKVSVIGKTFRKERVPLDGFSYIDCEFIDVTFVYEGRAPFDILNPTITGPPYFDSPNPAIKGYGYFVAKVIKAFNPDAKITFTDDE